MNAVHRCARGSQGLHFGRNWGKLSQSIFSKSTKTSIIAHLISRKPEVIGLPFLAEICRLTILRSLPGLVAIALQTSGPAAYK